jgi:hypothetical protein
VQGVHHQDGEHDVPERKVHAAIAQRLLPAPRFLIIHDYCNNEALIFITILTIELN